LLLIAYAFAFFTAETPFPGWRAAVPCLGSALIIVAADRSALAPLLTNPLSVYIGKISYSIYLVHWPILVLYRYQFFDRPLTLNEVVLLGALILVSALVLYYAIERPLHYGKVRPGLLAWGAGATAAVLVGIGAHMYADRGWEWRFPTELQAMFRYRENERELRPDRVCYFGVRGRVENYRRDVCLTRRAGALNILLVGDSHSARMRIGLQRAFPDAHLMQAGMTSCRAVLGSRGRSRSECPALMNIVFQEAIPAGVADYIVLSSNWRPGDVRELDRTLDYLEQFDTKVIVFGPVPTFTQDMPHIMFRSRAIADRDRYIASFLDPGRSGINANVRAVALSHAVHYLDFMSVI
jgi:hypothetical protein